MPFAEYKDFADCVAKNKDKGNPDAYCAVIQRQVEKGNKSKSHQSRANAVMGGLELKSITGKQLPDLSVLAGVELGELMEFKGATLARAEINRNRDELTPKHIDQLADTLKGMAITDDHAERSIVGYITAAHSRNRSSEVKIDGVVFARRFPEIADGIQSGKFKLSVEADADQAACSKCGKVFSSIKEYCEHLHPVQNRFSANAYRSFPGEIKGVGAGVVRNPAGTDTNFDTNRIVMIAGLEAADAVPDLQAEPRDVNLRVAAEDERRCGVCEYFNHSTLGCKLVAGFIPPGAVCDWFEKGEPDDMDKDLQDRLLQMDSRLKAMEDKEKEEKDKGKDMKDEMDAAIKEALKAYLGEGLPGNPAPANTDLPTPPGQGLGLKKEEYVKTGNPSGWQMEAAEVVFSRGMAAQTVLGADEFKKHLKIIPTFTADQWSFVEAVIQAKANQVEADEEDNNPTLAHLIDAVPQPTLTATRNGKQENSLYGGIKAGR